MKLRSYQKQAVDAIFDAWQKFKSVLVVLPTGCGKTVVFASVIRRLMTAEVKAKGEGEQKRVVVLAHREELVSQARDKITAIVPEADVQVEMADFKVVDYFGKKPDVVVSTVQTQCAPLGRKVKVEGEGEHAQLASLGGYSDFDFFSPQSTPNRASVSSGERSPSPFASPPKATSRSLLGEKSPENFSR